MDPRALAEFITATLDGTYGPDDEGYIAAWRDPDGETFQVAYTDDEFGVVSVFRLTLEPM